MIKIGDTGVQKLYLGEAEIKKAYVGEEIVFQESKSRLPAGYTEVEYIQNSNESSYINTYKSINNSDFTIEISAPQYTNNYSQKFIFLSNYFSLYASNASNGSLILLSGSNSSSQKNYGLGKMSTNKIIVEGSGRSVSANGVNVALDFSNYGINMIFPYSSSSLSTIIRLYSFKATNSSYPTSLGLNFELIPCINPSGIAGLYDLTNAEFIGPTAGTFIAGPEV